MSEQAKPWASFGYEPVGLIANKLLARYLRTQRKNMRRFFAERGLYALTERMNEIRKSNHGMMTKNRNFQMVLNDYAKLTTPATDASVPGSPLQQAPPGEGVPEAAR
jgi:hypothetical protein